MCVSVAAAAATAIDVAAVAVAAIAAAARVAVVLSPIAVRYPLILPRYPRACVVPFLGPPISLDKFFSRFRRTLPRRSYYSPRGTRRHSARIVERANIPGRKYVKALIDVEAACSDGEQGDQLWTSTYETLA